MTNLERVGKLMSEPPEDTSSSSPWCQEWIDCSSLTPESRRRVQAVLDRIRVACPDDFERLLLIVERIVPVPQKEAQDGTLGEWKKHQEIMPDPADPNWVAFIQKTGVDLVGHVEIREDLDEETFSVSLAHEFGHACTTVEDLDEQHCPEEEWQSECAADRYAYLWGFEAELSRHQGSRQWVHHGPSPGRAFECYGRWFVATEDYRLVPLETGPPQADVGASEP